ncbi:MAG: fdrA domain protein [Nitrososphaeria archaeon]
MGHKKSIFNEEIKVISIGIKDFYDSLMLQNVKTLHVDWRPPASGDKHVLDLLDRINNK